VKRTNIPLKFLTWIVRKNVITKLEKFNVQIIDINESENAASLLKKKFASFSGMFD
jgi:hypothetical protein